jgi:DNA-binding NtrC family response regulator
MVNVLVCDDEEPLRRLLKNELTRKGYAVSVAADAREAQRQLAMGSYDVILLDVVMPGMDGLTLMKKLGEDPATPPIIVLTGKATVETAVDAMKNGAFDYLTKPYKLDELAIVVDRAAEFGHLRVKSALLEQELVRKELPFEFIGTSRQVRDILTLIKKVAPTDSPVFIQGESGTGKELVANTIWHYSLRNNKPFIPLNVSTLSENLIESELFGHEKGSFTGAHQLKHGLVEVADKGTLFLDEIGEMPIALQAKLLRFLDSGEFRRVGGNKALRVSVRLITATNKDLTALIKAGRFREDLYYRLNVITVALPPLRERKEDIPALARHFVGKYARKLAKNIRDLTPDALDLLMGYQWPGNVRELESMIERGVILCEVEILDSDCLSILSPVIERGAILSRDEILDSDCPSIPSSVAMDDVGTNLSLQEMEKTYILRVLKETNNNQSRASHLLGIDRKTLYLKLKKYGIN